jgi:hypothetical protein
MKKEFENMIDKYEDFLESVGEFRGAAGLAVLYKLIAFDLVEDKLQSLTEDFKEIYEVLNSYGYEQ